MASSISQPIQSADEEISAGFGKENPTTFEEDRRYQIILEQVSLTYLQRKDRAYLNKNYSGIAPSGYFLDKKGKETNFLPSHHINVDLPKVQRDAQEQFVRKYPEDGKRYTAREAEKREAQQREETERKKEAFRRNTEADAREQQEAIARQRAEIPSPKIDQQPPNPVARNPADTRSAQGEIPNRPANSGSFEDDLKEGLPQSPSVEIDPSYGRALDRSNPSPSVAVDPDYQREANKATSPVEIDPEYQDALENQWASDLANSQAREHRNQKDAAEQEEGSLNDLLNKSPSGDYLPLVSDEGSPVGLSAAYDGLAYGAPGIETGGFGAPAGGEESKAQPFSPEEENEDQEGGEIPGNQQARTPGAPGESEQVAGRSNSNRRIKAVEQQIDQKQGEINRLKKRIEDYNKKFIDPLKRAARAAIFVDTVVTIETYMAFTSWWWWLTVIGAILDIGLVFPGIIIFYGAGIVKGRVGKTVQKNLRKEEAVVKNMLDARKTLEQQILQLRQRYFQLLQESRNPKQPGQGPSTPGNSNRPPTAPFSGVGLAT